MKKNAYLCTVGRRFRVLSLSAARGARATPDAGRGRKISPSFRSEVKAKATKTWEQAIKDTTPF